MKHLHKIIVVSIVFILWSNLLSGEPKKNVAVVKLQEINISRENAYALTTQLRSELFNLNVFNVMEREKMTAILDEQQFSVSGCTSDECIVEVGRLLSVHFIVSGSIQKLDDVFIVDLRIIDVSSSEIISNVNDTWDGSFADLLSQFNSQLTNELIARYLSRKHISLSSDRKAITEDTGLLKFTLSENDAFLSIDGTSSGQQPYKEITLKLSPGEHTISFSKTGYKKWQQTLTVIADKMTPIQVSLEPVGTVTSTQQEVKYGILIINTTPENSEVTIDNIVLGQTPFQKKIGAGEHAIRIQKNLYYPANMKIEIKPGEFTKKDISLEGNFGTLSLTSEPEGAAIFLDGNRRANVTPTTLTRIKSGLHTLKLQKNDYHDYSKEIIISDKLTLSIQANLIPTFGQLEISSVPKGAKVYIDNEYRGETPCKIEKIYSRDYNLRMEKEFYKTWETMVTVEDAKFTRIDHILEENFGTLNVLSKPKDATIYLDNEEVGKTPFTVNKVTSGLHTLKIAKEHHKPIEKDVHISIGKSTEVTENLLPLIGTLLISSIPTNASVYIDDEYKGRSEIKLNNVWAGKREVRVELPGYTTYQKTVDLPYKGTEFLTAKLDKLVYIVPRKKAMLKSLILPGWGQLYSNRSKPGVAFSILFGLSLRRYFAFDQEYAEQQKKYQSAYDNYKNSTDNETEIRLLWNIAQKEYDSLDDINKNQQICLGVTAIVWAYNIFDAYYFVPKIKEGNNLSIKSVYDNEKLELQLSLDF